MIASIRNQMTIIGVCAVLCTTAFLDISVAELNEYQIKAAFLYNFAKFVEWPAEVFSDANTPIVIGIIGDDPFGSSFEQTVKGKTVSDRRLIIKRFERVQGVGSCHILFVSSSERNHLSKILEAAKTNNVLTVSEIDNFANKGGVIGFSMDQNKIGFVINVEAAKKAKLKISSKLLRLAKVVKE
ncbi:MAG: YfiR family protein [Armatimonadota bacterium]|nr:YfiR family protein [Armatimonadota bacterium]